MRETREHIEAFDYYYSLGEFRSLGKVAQKFGKGNITVKRWSSEFHWQNRVQERDQQLGEQLILRTNEEILGFHEMNREIAKNLIQDYLDRVKDGKIKLHSIADWKRVVEIEQMIAGKIGEAGDDNMRSLAEVLKQSVERLYESKMIPPEYQFNNQGEDIHANK
ncbi:MAG TPA: hypothetical protein VGE40_11295 [Bacilli bacterium]